MATLPTTDISFSDVQTILSDTGDASLSQLCNHVNVDPLGLNPTYCAGTGVTDRWNTLKTAPYKLGNFRGYSDPTFRAFIQNYQDSTIYRGVSAETLHSSVAWDAAIQYYTGTAFSAGLYNITLMITNSQSVTDIAQNLGAVNMTFAVTSPTSPVWLYRFNASTTAISLAAGSYYWCWRMGATGTFLSDSYGEDDLFMPLTIARYIKCDPDTFNNYPGFGATGNFGIYSGEFTTSTVTAGTVTLTGGTTGTGNRTQGFSVPPNGTGSVITHTIQVSAPSTTSDFVNIYQDPI